MKSKKDPVCPKCKKPLHNASHHMMGIDKKCFDCQICWTYRHGFKMPRASNVA